MNNRPCEKDGQNKTCLLLSSSLLQFSEREQHKMYINTHPWISEPCWPRIFKYLPKQKKHLKSHSCFQPIVFLAVSQTLHEHRDFWGNVGHGKLKDEQASLLSTQLERLRNLQPFDCSHFISLRCCCCCAVMWAFCVVLTRYFGHRGKYLPVPCSLLLFRISYLWTWGVFQIPYRVYWCHEFKCCDCSKWGFVPVGEGVGGGRGVCGCHPS